jgi:hypothetical protein
MRKELEREIPMPIRGEGEAGLRLGRKGDFVNTTKPV